MASERGLRASNSATMYQVFDAAGVAAGIPISCMDDVYAAMEKISNNPFVEQIFRDGVIPALAKRIPLNCQGYSAWTPHIKMGRGGWLKLLANLGLEHEPIEHRDIAWKWVSLTKGNPSSSVQPFTHWFLVRAPSEVAASLGTPEVWREIFRIFAVHSNIWAPDLVRMLRDQNCEIVDTIFRYSHDMRDLALSCRTIVTGDGHGAISNTWTKWHARLDGSPASFGSISVGGHPNSASDTVPKGTFVLAKELGKD